MTERRMIEDSWFCNERVPPSTRLGRTAPRLLETLLRPCPGVLAGCVQITLAPSSAPSYNESTYCQIQYWSISSLAQTAPPEKQSNQQRFVKLLHTFHVEHTLCLELRLSRDCGMLSINSKGDAGLPFLFSSTSSAAGVRKKLPTPLASLSWSCSA